MKTSKKCWVVMLEHYHFAPKEHDMVACRCLGVWAGSVDGRVRAKEYALKEVIRHSERFEGTVERYPKEGTTTDKPTELRLWVKSENIHCDVFVWVVKQADFHG